MSINAFPPFGTLGLLCIPLSIHWRTNPMEPHGGNRKSRYEWKRMSTLTGCGALQSRDSSAGGSNKADASPSCPLSDAQCRLGLPLAIPIQDGLPWTIERCKISATSARCASRGHSCDTQANRCQGANPVRIPNRNRASRARMQVEEGFMREQRRQTQRPQHCA